MDENCLQEFEEISTQDLSKVNANALVGIVLSSGCQKVPQNIESARVSFLDRCKSAQNKSQTHECLEALYLYRSRITDYFNKDSDLNSITDPKVLFEILYSTLSQTDINFEKVKNVSDRFLEIVPDSKEVQRVGILTRLFKIPENNEKGSESYQEELESLYQKYVENNSEQDSKIVELGIFIRTKNFSDTNLLSIEAQNLINLKSEFADVGHYLKGGVLWREGNKTEAINEVKKAASINPKDPRYQQTLEKLSTLEPGIPGAFSMNFDASLSFDLEQN